MSAALACGAVVFPGLFYGLRTLLRRRFTRWSEADVVCVSERLVSSIHACLATAAGIVIVTTCNDVMTDSHWLADGFSLFGAPYMVYDIFAMYLSHYHRVKGHSSYSGHSLQTAKAFLATAWLMVVHHLALLLVFLPVALVELELIVEGRESFWSCVLIGRLIL